MALRTLVQSQVNAAFRLIGDLGSDVTLTNAAPVAYSFGTGTTQSTTQVSTASARGLIQETSRSLNNNDKSNQRSMLFPTSQLPAQFDQYDSIIIAGDTVPWDIVSWDDDGYLTTAVIRRTVV